MSFILNAKVLHESDTFDFTCNCCSDCCRNVENTVMVESLDLFRIARHLRLETSQVFEEYTEFRTVAWGAPILLMKTKGDDNSCVFLESGRCSIRDARTRACRLYPLSIGPNDDLTGRIILKSPERGFHYSGQTHKAGDWVDANMDSEDTAYIWHEYRMFKTLGRIMSRIPRERENEVLTQMMIFRFIMFDTDCDFMTQFENNMKQLKMRLEQMVV